MGVGNFGQISHNEMYTTNNMELQSNPQSNSRVHYIPPVTNQMHGQVMPNKKQLKSRKGLNQSIDLKQNVMKTMRASTQLNPNSGNNSLMNTGHSRKQAMDMNDQNNYASQISGWVNQSIIPHQQMGM